jgi:murein DD-endopeptidase MepM/ murein hydrolase activator NlpD
LQEAEVDRLMTKSSIRCAESAELLIRGRRYEEAVALCGNALRGGRAPLALRLLLSRALIALHRARDAAAQLTECLSLDPDCAEAYRMLGQLALRHDEYGRAIELLQTALRLTPDDESVRILIGVTRAMQARGPEDAGEAVTIVTAPDEGAAPMQLASGVRRGVRPVFGVALGVAMLIAGWSAVQAPRGGPTWHAAPASPARPTAAIAAAKPAPTGPAEGWTQDLENDTWIHPLAGPTRRMPTRDSRVFGAERPGDRPAECQHGHCGVDLGEVWGESVMAVHDGVVERVQRGANPEHGGQYVRLSHRGGTVLTEYFHLAAIPRTIAVGRKIKAGQVIGLLGDTGIKQSEPHLHFSLIVRPEKGGPERYVDPQSLVALWPLLTPVAPGHSLVDASAAPGIPVAMRPARKRKARKPSRAAAAERRARELGASAGAGA